VLVRSRPRPTTSRDGRCATSSTTEPPRWSRKAASRPVTRPRNPGLEPSQPRPTPSRDGRCATSSTTEPRRDAVDHGGLGAAPSLIEPVEMTAARAPGRVPARAAEVSTSSTSGWASPSPGCGGLDKLDQRVGQSQPRVNPVS